MMQQSSKTAGYQDIQNGQKKKIMIVSNPVRPNIQIQQKKCPKYKKLGKETKSKLIKLVSIGYPIIVAAQKLQINYSTAKSIIQKQKKDNPNKQLNIDQNLSQHGYLEWKSDQQL